MMQRKIAIWVGLFSLMGLVLACNFSGTPTATPIPTPIPTRAAVEGGVTAVPPTVVLLPTNTAVSATMPATAVATPEQVATKAQPTASVSEVVQPTPAMVGTAVRLFGPGQQDKFTLAAGAFKTYTIQGVKFQPLFVFAETTGEADLTLKAAAGTDTAVSNP
ncbi:MAG: hypothetical protein WBP47_15300, partial [Candidatus Promineifilaceae bacterium]